jgi:hypothetical protein
MTKLQIKENPRVLSALEEIVYAGGKGPITDRAKGLLNPKKGEAKSMSLEEQVKKIEKEIEYWVIIFNRERSSASISADVLEQINNVIKNLRERAERIKNEISLQQQSAENTAFFSNFKT